MNAKEFFEKHSIEEISKKTKISPISLRYIRNKEFDKLPRVKFVGFIKLIQREFNVDLSDLIEEYDEFYGKKPVKQKEEQKQIPKEKNEKPNQQKTQQPKKEGKDKFLIVIFAIIIVILAGYLLYVFMKKHNEKPSQNITKPIIETNISKENNSTQTEYNITTKTIKNNSNDQNKTSNAEKTSQKNQIKKEIKYVKIIPNKLLWFKAVNLDTNKTYEYLTSKPKTLPGNHYYIKLGHGEETIEYGDLNITPKTKKIVRIILQNGTYKYVKKAPKGIK